MEDTGAVIDGRSVADVVEHLREVEVSVFVLDLGESVGEHLVGLAQ